MKLLPPKEENKEEKEGPGASPEDEGALFGLTETTSEFGYVTYEQIDALLSSDDVKSEQIDDILAKITEVGVSVIESGSNTDIETKGEATTSAEPKEEFEAEDALVVVRQRAVSTTRTGTAPAERIDDPLRIYLRDMGSMSLLSREGEIAIAKRIEAGHEAMMAGLCESPLTFHAITIWRDELYDGKVLLRDIIDLDATNTDRGVKPTPAPKSDIERHPISDYLPDQPDRPPQMPASPTQFGAGEPIGDRTPKSHEVVSESDIDEDDMQKWLSISAMEAELQPNVFDELSLICHHDKRVRLAEAQETPGRKARAFQLAPRWQNTRTREQELLLRHVRNGERKHAKQALRRLRKAPWLPPSLEQEAARKLGHIPSSRINGAVSCGSV